MAQGRSGLSRRAAVGAMAGVAFARPLAAAQPRALRIASPSGFNGADAVNSGFILRDLEVAETLVSVGLDGRLGPGLAHSYEAAGDGMRWRFALRSSARFHDGAPVSAEIVVEALRHARRVAGGPLQDAPIETIEAADGDVLIGLSRPFFLLPAALASGSSVILGSAAATGGGSRAAILGTGLYRIIGTPDPDRIEIAATSREAEGGPAVQAATLFTVADGETRARMLQAGDADVALTISPAGADRLRRAGFAVLRASSPRVRYVMLNAADPRLSDVRVRRALSMALDRRGAAAAILRNADAAATRWMPPIVPDWPADGGPFIRHDLAAAGRLLDEAGWRRGADGLRAKDGSPLAFQMLTYAWRPELPALAAVVQAQWRELGVDLRIDLETPERILGRSRDGSLQAAFITRSYYATPDIVATLAVDFVAASPAHGWGAVGWRSADMESAIRRYAETADPSIRAGALATIACVVHDELPIIPHSWYDELLAHSDAVVGVVADPFETSLRLSGLRWR